MIVNPSLGQLVKVHYNKKRAPMMPHHDKTGRVVIVSKGKPRNHGIDIDGVIVCVPCGNLMPAIDDKQKGERNG